MLETKSKLYLQSWYLEKQNEGNKRESERKTRMQREIESEREGGTRKGNNNLEQLGHSANTDKQHQVEQKIHEEMTWKVKHDA